MSKKIRSTCLECTSRLKLFRFSGFMEGSIAYGRTFEGRKGVQGSGAQIYLCAGSESLGFYQCQGVSAAKAHPPAGHLFFDVSWSGAQPFLPFARRL